MIYCLTCKKRTGDVNPTKVSTKNGRLRMRAHCKSCNGLKSSFLPNGAVKTGGDIVKLINKTGKEFHVPGYNFCGPGTKLSERLDSNDNPITRPVNAIDKACMKHDIAYRDNKDLRSRQKADVKLIHDLNSLHNLKLMEKFTRGLIKTAMKGKIAFGMGINKKENGY